MYITIFQLLSFLQHMLLNGKVPFAMTLFLTMAAYLNDSHVVYFQLGILLTNKPLCTVTGCSCMAIECTLLK